jgi:hypothetical protein
VTSATLQRENFCLKQSISAPSSCFGYELHCFFLSSEKVMHSLAMRNFLEESSSSDPV